MSSLPLVVDLDGTLIRSDMLAESIVGFLRRYPWRFLQLLTWLSKGKAYLKDRLAHLVPIDVEKLPYDQTVLGLIKAERAKGRKIVLATASHYLYAEQIAKYLGLFDEVLATSIPINLSAHRKRDKLVEKYGENQFDYVGNARDDLIVWRSAREAYVAKPEWGVTAKVNCSNKPVHFLSTTTFSVKSWIKAFRLHQWTKNLLIFVPLLASHQFNNIQLLSNGILAFFFFGLCASSVYILNDLLDLEDDRHHTKKCHRPFAAGKLSIISGLVMCPLLLFTAFAGSIILLPWLFTATLASYYTLTLVYSLWLKRRMTVDVIALAILYTLRIVAGAFAMSTSLTFWMLAFSMFIFLSMALVKRYAELREAKLQGKTEKMRGRGYYPDDLEMIASLGAASGYLSVMILALYIQDHTIVSLYHHPQLIWLACPVLLFWITRIWLLTHRGMMHEDPVVFAVKDRISLYAGFLFGLIFWLAT